MSTYKTEQRKIFLDYLSNNTDKLLSASEIFEDLKNSNISLSAVYRNIAMLEGEGKLSKHFKNGDKTIYYQYLCEEKCKGHIHLSCVKCGKTKHMDEDKEKKIFEATKSTDFAVDTSEIVLYGICDLCQKQK